MKPPRLSTRSIMTVLIVVALDCVVYRSFAMRPAHVATDDFKIVLATLPMANLLAVVIAHLAGGRVRPFWVGFSIGGLGGLLGTIPALRPALIGLESVLTATVVGNWLAGSPVGQTVGFFLVLVALPLLFQLLGALTFGVLARKLSRTSPRSSRGPRIPVSDSWSCWSSRRFRSW